MACAFMMSTLVRHLSNGLRLLYHASSPPQLDPCIGWRLPTARSSAMDLEPFPSGYRTMAKIHRQRHFPDCLCQASTVLSLVHAHFRKAFCFYLRLVTEVSPSVSGVPGDLEILQSST